MIRTFTLPMAHRSWPNILVGSLMTLLSAILPVRQAAASPLAYEGFQYVAGQTLPTMAGPFGWAAGPWTGSGLMVDQPPTLSYPAALPSSGDALYNPAAGEAWRNFLVSWDNSLNDLWISFQEDTPAAGSGAFVDILPVSGPDIQVNKTGGGKITLNGLAAGISAGVGNVDFFVLQYVRFSGGVTWVNLWLNPGPVLTVVPSASFPIPSVVQIRQFYYRTDPGQLLDEIRVGTTPQDVAAVNVGAPKLTIAKSGNIVIVSWPYPSNGWTLQQSTDLTIASWSTSGGISNDGTNNFITITQPTGNLFFRLNNP